MAMDDYEVLQLQEETVPRLCVISERESKVGKGVGYLVHSQDD